MQASSYLGAGLSIGNRFKLSLSGNLCDAFSNNTLVTIKIYASKSRNYTFTHSSSGVCTKFFEFPALIATVANIISFNREFQSRT